MKLKKTIIMILLLGMAHGLHAQQDSKYRKLLEIAFALKQIKTYGYDYTLQATFPTGQQNNMQGEAYVDSRNRILFNKSQYHVILCSDNWFYRADMRQKTVTVVDLRKHYNDKNKQEYREDIFNNNMVSVFLDSVVTKFGKIRQYAENGDTIQVVLGFEKGLPLQKMELKFNTRTRMPVMMKIYTFYEDEPGIYGKPMPYKGTSQVITCTHYRRSIEMKEVDTDRYFRIDNRKVMLLQYPNYKLYSLL